jgi:hypothetical protein
MSVPITSPYPPTSPLVAVAWLSQRVAGLNSSMVATSLPRDVTTWAAVGFVQATAISGRPDIDVPIRGPLVQIDAWAVNVDAAGNVMPSRAIAKANRLAELVRLGTEDQQEYGKPVTLPNGYAGARVLSVYPLTEPAEVPDDPSGYARVTLDLAFNWTRA